MEDHANFINVIGVVINDEKRDKSTKCTEDTGLVKLLGAYRSDNYTDFMIFVGQEKYDEAKNKLKIELKVIFFAKFAYVLKII